MKGALIHGVLLAVMLVYGYRTWTRDKTVKPDLGSVVLWDRAESDFVSISYKSDTREVKLERRAGYWWGTDTTIEKRPKAEPPKQPDPGAGSGSGSAAKPADPKAGSAAGSGSGSAAGSGAGSGSGSAATPPPPPPEMEEIRKTREFPLGEGGQKIVNNYVAARAIRDLGTPTDAQKKTYKLDAPKGVIVVAFKDGTRTFQLGDLVYGNQDKYALDDKGTAYVLSKDMLTSLESGETSLYLADPRGFDLKLIDSVVLEGGGKTKTAERMTTGVEGKQVKTWGDAATKKPHPSLGNFIDQLGSLPTQEYSPKTRIETLTPIVKMTYRAEGGDTLGSLTLYKGEKPPVITPDMEIDPANPPRGEIEYYVMTEKSRVPVLVRKDGAQQAEQNFPVVMSEKPPESTGPEPKGNPFGKGPLPTPDPSPRPGHGGMPPGHGGLTAPAGSATTPAH